MSNSASVLVVARDVSLVQQVVRDLQTMGTDVQQADTLACAVRMLTDTPVDVVLCLTDGMNWRAALTALQQVGSAVPVVFLTRGADVPVWLEMLDAGAFDLVDRRYRLQELEWVVANAAGRHSFSSATAV